MLRRVKQKNKRILGSDHAMEWSDLPWSAFLRTHFIERDLGFYLFEPLLFLVSVASL